MKGSARLTILARPSSRNLRTFLGFVQGMRGVPSLAITHARAVLHVFPWRLTLSSWCLFLFLFRFLSFHSCSYKKWLTPSGGNLAARSYQASPESAPNLVRGPQRRCYPVVLTPLHFSYPQRCLTLAAEQGTCESSKCEHPLVPIYSPVT